MDSIDRYHGIVFHQLFRIPTEHEIKILERTSNKMTLEYGNNDQLAKLLVAYKTHSKVLLTKTFLDNPERFSNKQILELFTIHRMRVFIRIISQWPESDKKRELLHIFGNYVAK